MKTMKKLHFDEKLESLVDESSIKYEGKRFSTVYARTLTGYSRPEDARTEVLTILEKLASEKGANAYEIFELNGQMSRQEFDPKPYFANATAILYKSK